MAPTTEAKIRALLLLPWTLDVRRADGGLVATIAELPSVVASGATDEELDRDLWGALRASLACYLHFDDPIPLPPGVTRLPWDPSPPAPRLLRFARSAISGEWGRIPEATASVR